MSSKKHKQDEIMDADETASWLKIPKSTLYKLCNDGEIPAAKVGRHWRFKRNTLEDWLHKKTSERSDQGKAQK